MITQTTFTKIYVVVFLFFFSTIFAQTTWNGSTWIPNPPNSTLDAMFTGNYSSTATIVAKSISITNNAQVTIIAGNTLTVENGISVSAGSNLIFENTANLIQNNASAVNTGNITFRRNTVAMRKYDYTYWSSPVTGQTLSSFSPLTNSNRFYSFNASTAVNNWAFESPSNIMASGKGYAIMAPNNYTATLQIFNGEFIGIPHNGNVPVNVVLTGPSLIHNLVGNPYPSAINVQTLIDNTTLGTLYFWTHNTPITNNVFTTNDYAIRTRNSGTVAISGGTAPGLYIAAGQGFFASSSATGTITFTNAMRVAGNNSQFYKETAKTKSEPNLYYFWLNLTNLSGAFKQIAIGYEEGATNGYDFGIDAFTAIGNIISFYSTIDNNNFAIQARAYPWTSNDVIPIGYSSTIKGSFDINLDHNSPFFDTGAIYLFDADLNLHHNLKSSPYTFNTAVGTFNNRFVIRFVNPTLGVDENILDEKTVTITANNQEINAFSPTQNIRKIQVYDLLGRLIFEDTTISQKQYTIRNLLAQNQTLIIKLQLENNQNIVKKLIY